MTLLIIFIISFDYSIVFDLTNKFIYRSYLFNDLDYIFVQQNVIFSYFLGVELYGGSPNHRISEVSDHASMDFATEIFHT